MTKSKGHATSRKKSPVKCKECGLETIVEFVEDGAAQYPVFSCLKHGIQRNDWQKWWQEYSERWRDKKFWDSPKDKLSCVIGYFCHKYKEFYGWPYIFDMSSPIPYKNKDFTMGRRILSMFDGNVGECLVYVKWVFKKKVKTRKRKVTSLGFFTLPEFANEYRQEKNNSQILKRCSLLPKDFLEWCENECPEVSAKGLKTWNDLNALISFVDAFGKDVLENRVVEEATSRGLLKTGADGKPEFRKLED